MLLYHYRSLLSPYYISVLLFLYFAPYMLLIFRGQFLINPIQPVLMFLCFEIYSVSKKVAAEGGRLKYRGFFSIVNSGARRRRVRLPIPTHRSFHLGRLPKRSGFCHAEP